MTTAENPIDNTQFETFPELHETPEEIAFELRAQEGALWTGGRLLIGIWAFAFAALAFAYFYLRSANNQDLWRPGGVTGNCAPCTSPTSSVSIVSSIETSMCWPSPFR